MTINRNNYENYFLLYIDNELCQADKKMVEAFVQQHTDLKQELVMLQQVVLQPDDISFAQKNNLLKAETTQQERLLLLLDGELGPAEAAALQKEIEGDKYLLQEWALLKQTKLQPEDTVVFEHKEILLRKEPAHVIPAKWWRAAAAVFIGFGLLGTLLMVNKNNKQAGRNIAGAVGYNGIIPAEKTVPASPVAQQPDARQTATVLQPYPATVKKGDAVTAASGAGNTVKEQKLVASAKEKAGAQKTSSSIRKGLENINNDESNETGIATVQLKERIAQPAATETNRNNSLTGLAKPVMESSLKENNALYAVNTKTDETQQSDYLTPDDKRFRRSGLIRKVSRFFQRSTKKKADGDGLKIAGFEFAVR